MIVNGIDQDAVFLKSPYDMEKIHAMIAAEAAPRVLGRGYGAVQFQFNGWALVLLPDGQWFGEDTSGG